MAEEEREGGRKEKWSEEREETRLMSALNNLSMRAENGLVSK